MLCTVLTSHEQGQNHCIVPVPVSVPCSVYEPLDQWQIRDFSHSGHQPLSLWRKPIIWQDFCQKTVCKEIDPRGGARVSLAPPCSINDTSTFPSPQKSHNFAL